MILVDSSVWIDYFNGNTTLASEKLDSLLLHSDKDFQPFQRHLGLQTI